MPEVYLDNSATTAVHPEVVAAMQQVMTITYGNPSSPHRKGLEAERALKNAREKIAAALGVDPATVIFTSGGTEANNLAILGTAARFTAPVRGHIITTAIEHSSVLTPIRQMERLGYDVSILPVDGQGRVDPRHLAEMLRDDTIIVSVMYVNNEIGTIQPIEAIAQTVARHRHKRHIPVLHVDAVQALGKMHLRPAALGVDLMSISAHKIHGPKGVGALYVRKGLPLQPITWGGDQELGLRPGTENVPGIVGFATALSLLLPDLDSHRQKLYRLRSILIQGVKEKFSDARINGPLDNQDAAPHIVNISFPYIKGETLVHALADKNIFVGTGSACHSRKRVVSHVIQAIGTPPEYQEGAIRISLAVNNTEADIQALLAALSEIVPTLQAMMALQER